MAEQEQVERLTRSIEEWNQWRRELSHLRPDLSGADLSKFDLRGANLSETDLGSAELREVNLSDTDLSGAYLGGANLYGANFHWANLYGANFHWTTFVRTSLFEANLSSADFTLAILFNSTFSGADLTKANFDHTTFAWVDLNNVKGLETAQHNGPSTLNINSVVLPTDEHTRKHFLRGVGFTETQIEHLPSLLIPRSIEYQSLFISYASQDEAIAQQLHADLRKKDVPCWFALHDLRPGDYFREEIDKAIHMQEKLLLILSKDSIASKWVKYEVNRALNREIEQERKFLYPIRLDDTVLNSTSGWAADLRAHRHIGDFTGWQDGAAYQEAFTKLLQYLKVTQPPAR